MFLIHKAEEEEGVGNGDLLTAETVAHRSRYRTRRSRAHKETTALVHGDDTAAAGADGMNIQHRDGQGVFVDLRSGDQFSAHVIGDMDIKAGAAHIG